MMDEPRRDVSELTAQIEAIVDTLVTDLAETEREREKAVEREAKTAEALTVARDERDALAGSLKNVRLGLMHWDVDADEWVDGPSQLPTPDATNPSHLRWAADLLDARKLMLDGRPVQSHSQADLRDQAARLEAEQQDDAAECGRVAWLATIGARATVYCTLPYAHDGNHYDAALGVDWGDDD